MAERGGCFIYIHAGDSEGVAHCARIYVYSRVTVTVRWPLASARITSYTVARMQVSLDDRRENQRDGVPRTLAFQCPSIAHQLISFLTLPEDEGVGISIWQLITIIIEAILRTFSAQPRNPRFEGNPFSVDACRRPAPLRAPLRQPCCVIDSARTAPFVVVLRHSRDVALVCSERARLPRQNAGSAISEPGQLFSGFARGPLPLH